MSSIRRRVAGAKTEWVKVSILRNKAFAHRANAFSVNEVFRQAQVKPNDLRRLLRRTQRLLNRISHALDRNSHAFNLGAAKDTKRMLADLKTYNIWRARNYRGRCA